MTQVFDRIYYKTVNGKRYGPYSAGKTTRCTKRSRRWAVDQVDFKGFNPLVNPTLQKQRELEQGTWERKITKADDALQAQALAEQAAAVSPLVPELTAERERAEREAHDAKRDAWVATIAATKAYVKTPEEEKVESDEKADRAAFEASMRAIVAPNPKRDPNQWMKDWMAKKPAPPLHQPESEVCSVLRRHEEAMRNLGKKCDPKCNWCDAGFVTDHLAKLRASLNKRTSSSSSA